MMVIFEGMTDRKRALVVDDDEPIRTMLAKVVEKQDLEVDTASDGAEAIERLTGDGYCVVLLDLMMPRVDGFAVLRYMQEHYPEGLKRTIIASAVPESEVLNDSACLSTASIANRSTSQG